jgi:hypothetical protein
MFLSSRENRRLYRWSSPCWYRTRHCSHRWSSIYWRDESASYPRKDYEFLADVLLRWKLHRILGEFNGHSFNLLQSYQEQVGYACQKHKQKLGDWDWKMIVIFQLLVPAFIVSVMFTLPETPRWYIQHGNRVEEARNSLRRVRDTEEEVEIEIMAIREAIEFEKEAISGTYWALFKDPSVRKRLLIAFALNAGQQITGQGTLNTYSTIVYGKVFKDTDTIFLINALNATLAIFFTMNATWTVDRFGRKFLFIVGALGMGVCMLCVATVYTQTPAAPGSKTATLPDGVKSKSVGSAIVFLFFLFAFFYKPSWGATTWIWTSEIFSMNVRTQAIGMASQIQNVANLITQQFFPTFLNHKGFYAFYMFAAINFCLAVFVYFIVPETRGVPLEEVDTLFGGANHVDKGADLITVESRPDTVTELHKGGDEKNEHAPETIQVLPNKG